MPNSTESMVKTAFKPLKIIDIYRDCQEHGGLPVNYGEFRDILKTMEHAKYEIVSYKQIDELKQMLKESRPSRQIYHKQGF